MKLFFSLLLTALVIFILASVFNSEDSEETAVANVRGYAITDVLSEVNNDEATVLDVRTQVEFDLGHIPVADVFNVEWLKAGQLPELDKDEKIYVYCRSGNRSADAKAILESNGYTNVIDLGGIGEWTEAGGETLETQLPDHLTLLEEMGEKPIPALGNADAEVTFVKYSDHLCPYCMKYTLETEDSIFEKYVETGKVRYEYVNLAYQGDESALAAASGYCANEQDKFWQYQKLAAVRYAESGAGFFTVEGISSMANDLGVDADQFGECVASGKYDSVVSSETISARNVGFTSTPAFLVGNQVINGALPIEYYETTIDAQL